MYPGDLLCILVTPNSACQGVVCFADGIRQPGAAPVCPQLAAPSSFAPDVPATDTPASSREGPLHG